MWFCSLDRLVFEAPFEPFVHRWGELLEFAKKKHDEKTTQDLDLLLGILKEELKDTIKAFEDFVTQGVIDWQNLWTVFQPGAILFSTVYGGIPVAVQFDRVPPH